MGIALCFWGFVVNSFFVVTVTNMLNFTLFETRAYNLLDKIYYKSLLKKLAVSVLQAAYIYRNSKINFPLMKPLILSKFRDFRSELLAFKRVAQHIRLENIKDV